MQISKSILSEMGAPYSICYGNIDGRKVIASGSETMGGEFTLYVGENWKPVSVIEGLGGIMGIIITEMNGVPTMITAEGLHPNFVIKDAGVSLYRAERGVSGPWKRHRLADFPYIHRISLVTAHGEQTVIAATLCGEKKDMDDWSHPGAVYAVSLQNHIPPFETKIPVILDGIHKNHGMYVKKDEGTETVYISGEEGLFAIPVPKGHNDWISEKILDESISEFAIFDFDGDGDDEIVAIQPFHGDMVCVYKKKEREWLRVFETGTELGHGIWAGSIGGKAGFILGSRAGNRDLCLYTMEESDKCNFKKHVIERGVGAAQIHVINEKDHDTIISTNNYTNEIALYRISS